MLSWQYTDTSLDSILRNNNNEIIINYTWFTADRILLLWTFIPHPHHPLLLSFLNKKKDFCTFSTVWPFIAQTNTKIRVFLELWHAYAVYAKELEAFSGNLHIKISWTIWTFAVWWSVPALKHFICALSIIKTSTNFKYPNLFNGHT